MASAPVAASAALPQVIRQTLSWPGASAACSLPASAADAASGADATALSGKYLPRKAAEQQAAGSGGKSRVFDYSNSTQAGNTGTYTITNNEEERAFCEGPEFNPHLRH